MMHSFQDVTLKSEVQNFSAELVHQLHYIIDVGASEEASLAKKKQKKLIEQDMKLHGGMLISLLI